MFWFFCLRYYRYYSWGHYLSFWFFISLFQIWKYSSLPQIMSLWRTKIAFLRFFFFTSDHASLEEKPAGGSTSTSDPASSTLPSDTPPSPQSQEADSSGSNLARLQTQPRTSGAISWPKTEMEFRAHFPTPTQSALALIGNLPELGMVCFVAVWYVCHNIKTFVLKD